MCIYVTIYQVIYFFKSCFYAIIYVKLNPRLLTPFHINKCYNVPVCVML